MPTYRAQWEAENAVVEGGYWVVLTDGQWREIVGETEVTLNDERNTYAGRSIAFIGELEDTNGKPKRRMSNIIDVPAIAFTDPPAQMDPPLLSQISYDQMLVTRAAAPADNGSPITSYNLRYSTDEADWIEVGNISTEYTLTGLSAETTYYVQTSAENPNGETWSGSASAMTEELPVVTTAPLGFDPAGWDVLDLATGGDATVFIWALPSDGGSPITDIVARVNGGTQFSLGISTTGTADAIARFTDGVASTVEIAAVNAVGQGSWSVVKYVTTTTATAGTVSNQTAEFGALTRAQAGGFMPVNNLGELIPLTSYNSLVSGSLGAYTPSIIAGRLVFSAIGCPNGAVLRCGYAGGTVDITISSVAGTYSVASVTEYQVVIGKKSGGIISSGQTCRIRRGEYASWLPDRGLKNRTFASSVVIEGEGTKATTLIGNLEFLNCTNVIVRNLDIYRTVRNAGSGCIVLRGTVNGMEIRDNTFRGPYNDPSVNYPVTFAAPPAVICAETDSARSFSGVIERNLCYDLYDVFILYCSTANSVTVQDNEWYRCGADGTKISVSGLGQTANYTVQRNVTYARLSVSSAKDGPHGDMIVQFNGNGAVITGKVTINQNFAFNGQPGASAGSHGIAGFADGPGGIPVTFMNIESVGNFCAMGGNNPWTLRAINGLIGNNVTVNTGPGRGAGAPNIDIFPESDSTNMPARTALTIRNNITEGSAFGAGGAGITQTNNQVIGKNGAITPYTTAFTNAGSLPAQTFADVKAMWISADNTKGAIGATGITIGNPRDPTGWAIDPALLTV